MYAFTHKFHVHILQEYTVDTDRCVYLYASHQRDIASTGVPFLMSLPLSAPLVIANMLSRTLSYTQRVRSNNISHLLPVSHVHHVAPN